MAWESVTSIGRTQACCYSCIGCCGCIRDMGTITIRGDDPSHPNGWQLVRIKNSTKIYKKMNKVLTQYGKTKEKRCEENEATEQETIGEGHKGESELLLREKNKRTA